MKENTDFFAEYIYFLNEVTESSKFSFPLKLSNVMPVFKKDSMNQKENYKPVSILLKLSEIFEKKNEARNCLHANNLSKSQCSFFLF